MGRSESGFLFELTEFSELVVSILEQLVGTSQNLDLVNYVINTDWSPLAAAPMDVQVAIWTIIDPDEFFLQERRDDAGIGDNDFDQDVVDAILLDALVNGHGLGFEPDDVGQRIAVIADPNNFDPDGTMQIIIIELPVGEVYTREETAWGYGTRTDGYGSGNGNWAMYFEFVLGP